MDSLINALICYALGLAIPYTYAVIIIAIYVVYSVVLKRRVEHNEEFIKILVYTTTYPCFIVGTLFVIHACVS